MIQREKQQIKYFLKNSMRVAHVHYLWSLHHLPIKWNITSTYHAFATWKHRKLFSLDAFFPFTQSSTQVPYVCYNVRSPSPILWSPNHQLNKASLDHMFSTWQHNKYYSQTTFWLLPKTLLIFHLATWWIVWSCAFFAFNQNLHSWNMCLLLLTLKFH